MIISLICIIYYIFIIKTTFGKAYIYYILYMKMKSKLNKIKKPLVVSKIDISNKNLKRDSVRFDVPLKPDLKIKQDTNKIENFEVESKNLSLVSVSSENQIEEKEERNFSIKSKNSQKTVSDYVKFPNIFNKKSDKEIRKVENNLDNEININNKGTISSKVNSNIMNINNSQINIKSRNSIPSNKVDMSNNIIKTLSIPSQYNEIKNMTSINNIQDLPPINNLNKSNTNNLNRKTNNKQSYLKFLFTPKGVKHEKNIITSTIAKSLTIFKDKETTRNQNNNYYTKRSVLQLNQMNDMMEFKNSLLSLYKESFLGNPNVNKIDLANIIGYNNEKYLIICISCEQLPYLPVECIKCNSIYCYNCIINLNKCIFNSCVNDLSSISNINIPSKSFMASLTTIRIKCSFSNCFEIVLLENIFNHEKDCLFKMILCSSPSCQMEIIRSNLSFHLLKECKYNLSLCEYCRVRFPLFELDIHIKSNCNDKPVECEGCHREYRRGDIESHKEKCDYMEYRCVMCEDILYNRNRKLHNCYKEVKEKLIDMENKNLVELEEKQENKIKNQNQIESFEEKIMKLEERLKGESIINKILKEQNENVTKKNIKLNEEKLQLIIQIDVKNEENEGLKNLINENQILLNEEKQKNLICISEKERLNIKLEGYNKEILRLNEKINEMNEKTQYLFNENNSCLVKYKELNEINSKMTNQIQFYMSLFTCSACGLLISSSNSLNSNIKILPCNHCDSKICSNCMIICSQCKSTTCSSSYISSCFYCNSNAICNGCLSKCDSCNESICKICINTISKEGCIPNRCLNCKIIFSLVNKSSLIKIIPNEKYESCETIETETCLSSYILSSKGYLINDNEEFTYKYSVLFRNKLCEKNDLGFILIENKYKIMNIFNENEENIQKNNKNKVFEYNNNVYINTNFNTNSNSNTSIYNSKVFLYTDQLPSFMSFFINTNKKIKSKVIVSLQKLLSDYHSHSANMKNSLSQKGGIVTVEIISSKKRSFVRFTVEDLSFEEELRSGFLYVPYFGLCNNKIDIIKNEFL